MTVGGLHGPIPSQLDWLKASEDGRAWLESLPTRIDECAAHWHLGHTRRDVLRRLDRLSSDLRLDRERARLWCFAQTVAWSIETTGALQDHLDVARWLLKA
jgi:hypothetical protein